MKNPTHKDPLVGAFEVTCARYGLLAPGDRVVAAVSGGPDSVVLLHLLERVKKVKGLSLAVAHLDHGIRRGSGRDAAFVESWARSLGLPYFGEGLTWKGRSRRAATEEDLRKKRYDFLARVCKKFRATKLALGHTQDDQAETVLLRILRGSGLYGLGSILPKRPAGSVVAIRPLIDISRRQIIDYARRHRLRTLADPTNAQDRFLRNKVRHRLLPLLEKEFNPGIKEGLARLASLVATDYDYLKSQADAFLKGMSLKKKGKWEVELKPLREAGSSLRRMAVRRLLEAAQGDLRRLTFAHATEIEDLILSRPIGSSVSLPQGWLVKTTSVYLVLLKR